MLTPLPLANALLVLSSTLFAMSVAIRSPFFVFYSFCALILSGQLVGAAKKRGR